MGWTTERARLAALERHNASPERLDAQRRDLRAIRTEDYLRKVLAEAPPLTSEQIARLRALLPPLSEDGAA
jgi:hypothetical protein